MRGSEETGTVDLTRQKKRFSVLVYFTLTLVHVKSCARSKVDNIVWQFTATTLARSLWNSVFAWYNFCTSSVSHTFTNMLIKTCKMVSRKFNRPCLSAYFFPKLLSLWENNGFVECAEQLKCILEITKIEPCKFSVPTQIRWDKLLLKDSTLNHSSLFWINCVFSF